MAPEPLLNEATIIDIIIDKKYFQLPKESIKEVSPRTSITKDTSLKRPKVQQPKKSSYQSSIRQQNANKRPAWPGAPRYNQKMKF